MDLFIINIIIYKMVFIKQIYPAYRIFERFVVNNLQAIMSGDQFWLHTELTRYVESPREVERDIFNLLIYYKGNFIFI